MMMNNETPEMELPGFRFHPTEEELLDFYLKTIVFGKKLRFNVIGFLDIYQHDPWDLPDLAKIGEREWYFFVPRDVKHGNGGRPNRTTEHGFWKATGSDRCIRSLSDSKRVLGLKKTLVFYTGRAPRGCKTDWVMNEYRMPQNSSSAKGNIVLCKIYRKATSLKVMEQRAAMEGELKSVPVSLSAGDTKDITPLHEKRRKLTVPITTLHEINVLGPNVEEPVESKENDVKNSLCASSSSKEFARADLPELQLPKFNLEWMQESYWTQLRSPWLDSWTPYASLLND